MTQRRQTPVARLPMEKSFYIDFYSEMEGKQYRGNFSIRRPNLIDLTTIAAKKSEMVGGKYYDPDRPGCGIPLYAESLSEAISFLQVCLVDAPEWWDEGNITDQELLFKIYMEAKEIDPFRSSKKPERDRNRDTGSVSEASDNESEQSGVNNDIAEMVDEEI